MDASNPRLMLARRLRALREDHWPGLKVTQPQLAQALGGSVPSISSWESQTNPKIPPSDRLRSYAAFFATSRSLEGEQPHLLSSSDLTDAERRTRDELSRELLRMRGNALRAAVGADEGEQMPESLGAGPWRFEDGNDITIVCAQPPSSFLEQIPYTEPDDPDYIKLYTYSDLDSLFELYGHLRATNPTNQVNLRTAQQLVSDDYTSHLIALGGVDWNLATSSVIERLDLPILQMRDSSEGTYFEVTSDDKQVERHQPRLENLGERKILIEDVALFIRAINPYNRKRTVTICNGMYGRGSYGAVRALTDVRFRDRNAEYIGNRFAGSEAFCLLTRVQVVTGSVVTPDWTISGNRLFEWSRSHAKD